VTVTQKQSNDAAPTAAGAPEASAAEVSAAETSAAEARRIRAVTAGAVALVSLVAFEALAVTTVMPAVVADLDGLPYYALGFGAPLAASVVGMAVSGAWADVRGPRRPLLAAVALFSLGLVVAGTAATMTLFVAGRGLQGLGGGMLVVALYAMLGSSVPERARPRLLAAFAAAWVLPAMVGPSIASLLLHAAGWRSVFLVVPLVAVPAAVLTLRGVADGRAVVQSEPPTSSSTGERRPTARGAVRRRIALAAVAGTGAAALQVVGTRDGPGWRLAAAGALAVVVVAAYRLLPRGTFRLARGVPSVVAVRGLISAGFAAAETFVPLLLVREHGWSPGLAGLALTAGAIAWSTTSWVQGRVPEVERRYGYARVGTALLLVGTSLVLVAALPGSSGLVVVAGWAFAGGGMGLVYASTSLLTLHLAQPERQGEASAALTTSEALTSALVIAVAGALFAALLPVGLGPDDAAGPAPYLAAFAVAVGTAGLSVVGAWRLRARRPR
jgi:MFS family permease